MPGALSLSGWHAHSPPPWAATAALVFDFFSSTPPPPAPQTPISCDETAAAVQWCSLDAASLDCRLAQPHLGRCSRNVSTQAATAALAFDLISSTTCSVCCAMDSSSSVGMTSTLILLSGALMSPCSPPTVALLRPASTDMPMACRAHTTVTAARRWLVG